MRFVFFSMKKFSGRRFSHHSARKLLFSGLKNEISCESQIIIIPGVLSIIISLPGCSPASRSIFSGRRIFPSA